MTDDAATNDAAATSPVTVQIEFDDAALAGIAETDQRVVVTRQMQPGSTAINWVAFSPLEANEISFDPGSYSVFVAETQLQPGATINVSADTPVEPGDTVVFNSDGTFTATDGSAPSGSVDVELAASPGSSLSVGLSAMVTVNGAQVSGPFGGVVAEPSTRVTLTSSETVRIFLSSVARTGTVLVEIPSEALEIDLDQTPNATVTYNSASGQFVLSSS